MVSNFLYGFIFRLGLDQNIKIQAVCRPILKGKQCPSLKKVAYKKKYKQDSDHLQSKFISQATIGESLYYTDKNKIDR